MSDMPKHVQNIDRNNIEHFIMDDDAPMTCPECGSRSLIDFEYDNGEQLHFCESDVCDMEYFLVSEPELTYIVDAVSDWDTATMVEVRGAVEEDGGCHIDDTRAEFYSIYVTEAEGTTMVVGDYDTLPRAREALIQLLADHPNITEGSKSLELVPTKPL